MIGLTRSGRGPRPRGDHLDRFETEQEMDSRPIWRGHGHPHSRAFALKAAKTLIPNSKSGVRALLASARLISVLPARLSRAAAKLNTKGMRLHDSMVVRNYTTPNRNQTRPARNP